MKIVFITALFGGKGGQPKKFNRIDEADYFLFSDRDQERFNTSWDVHNISDNHNISRLNCNIRKSRYPKFMGWELLESMNLAYDFIYYCDVHYSPSNSVDWNVVCDKIKTEGFSFAQDTHDNINVRRGGINAECKSIPTHRRDTVSNMNKTLNYFKHKYTDVNLNAPQYFQNTMFGYDPKCTAVRDITGEFWKAYTSSDITFRDQPLWNLLLLKNNLIPITTEPRLKDNLFIETGTYGSGSQHWYV